MRLASWKVPENKFTRKEKVTLRRLLSQTAGLNVHGFGGYPAATPAPTLVQVLDGRSRPTAPRSGPTPSPDTSSDIPAAASRWPAAPHDGGPEGKIPRPPGRARPATARDGRQLLRAAAPKPGAERRPAGTPPTASHARTLPHPTPKWPRRACGRRRPTWPASSRDPRALRGRSTAYRRHGRKNDGRPEARYGLGLSLQRPGPRRLGHGGSNEGFRCHMTAFIANGRGAVVMTNADGGGRLGVGDPPGRGPGVRLAFSTSLSRWRTTVEVPRRRRWLRSRDATRCPPGHVITKTTLKEKVTFCDRRPGAGSSWIPNRRPAFELGRGDHRVSSRAGTDGKPTHVLDRRPAQGAAPLSVEAPAAPGALP